MATSESQPLVLLRGGNGAPAVVVDEMTSGSGSRRRRRREPPPRTSRWGGQIRGQLDLLLRDELIRPVQQALAALADIREETSSAQPLKQATLAGLHVLAVSRLEVAIVETAVYVLSRNPWRMPFDVLEITRREMLAVEFVRELLEAHAERLVRKWTYGPKDQLFDRFLDVADLPATQLGHYAEAFALVSERRNKILHTPLSESGDGLRHLPPNPWPTHAEVRETVDTCTSVLKDTCASLQTRYEGHTRVAALRRLWTYLFTSPIMKFDDYWIVDSERDTIPGFKANTAVEQLARSERVLLGVWRAEFSGDASMLREFSMKSLDSARRRDLVILLAALRNIWTY